MQLDDFIGIQTLKKSERIRNKIIIFINGPPSTAGDVRGTDAQGEW